MKRLLFIFFSLLIICTLLLPYFFSSFGKPLFLKILQARFKSNIQIEKIHLSWLGPQEFNLITFSNDKIAGSISKLTSNVPFWALNHAQRSFQLEEGHFFSPQNETNVLSQVHLAVQGHAITASGSTLQGGSFAIQGTVQSKDQFDVTAQAKNIPSMILDYFLDAHLSPFVGDVFSLNGAYSFQNNIGAVTMLFSSSNVEASLNGSLQDEILTLKEPLAISLSISSQLNKYLAEHQSLITSIRARNPILLTLFTENTQIPVPFSLKTLQIGNGSLNLGKIDLESSKLFSFLKIFPNISFKEQIPCWFTPVSFQMEDGLLTLGRLDVLMNHSIHLCSWGSLNFLSERLNMTLGIPADTLNQYFNLADLSRNFVLTIPIKGTFQEPEFVTGPAIAKIAAMSTSGQLPGSTGKIFGKVINKAVQKKEEEKVPPANRPFPWEK